MNKKYINAFLLCSLVAISVGVKAQVRIVNSTTNSAISNSSSFIDASSNTITNTTSNEGKGLLFPRTDLTVFTTFGGSPIGTPASFPYYYDGLIVYNTATSGVAGVGSTQGTLTAGYWYYDNKSGAINGGTWKPVSPVSSSYTGSTSVTLNGSSFERAALTGDVTASANSNATTVAKIQGKSVSTTAPTNGQVLKYNTTTSAWEPAADTGTTYTGSTSVTLNGTSFERPALTGDVTASANSNATTIANNAVTSAKIADGAIATADIAANAVTVAKLPTGATATTFLRGDGTWVTPTDTNTTYTADNGLTLSGNNLSLGGTLTANTNLASNGKTFTVDNISATTGTTLRISTGAGTTGYSQNSNGRFDVDAAGVVGGRFTVLENGNVGIGASTPGTKLEVGGQVKITGGTPGTGKVLTSDANGLASWVAVPSDNLGNHTATLDLNMSGKNITNAFSLGTTVNAGSGGSTHWYLRNAAGSQRWGIGTQLVEATGNVGEDFTIWNYSNTGGWLGTPLLIKRSTGNVTFGSQIQISGGSPGAGKVLTSDANGLASWATPANSTYTTSNGLTVSANDIKLGGALTGATTISNITSTNTLSFTSPDAASAAITVGSTSAGSGGVYFGNTNHGVKRGFPTTGADNNVGLYTTAGNLYLSTNGTATDRFVLNSDGNIGIGTSSPTTKLSVAGSAIFKPNTSNNGTGDPVSIQMYGTNGSDYTAVGGIKMRWHDQNPVSINIVKGVANNDGAAMGFNVSSDATNEFEAMRIQKSGNIGIGLDDPQSKLHVNGIITSGPFSGVGGGLNLGNGNHGIRRGFPSEVGSNNNVGLYTTGGNIYLSTNGNADAGQFAMVDGNVGIGTGSPGSKLHVNGTIKASRIEGTSDIRFKKDIHKIYGATEKLNQLNGYTYTWRDKTEFPGQTLGEGKDVGVIAQEVEQVFPDAVSTNKDGYKSVNYNALIPVLIEALKESNSKIDRLEQQIKALESVKAK
ncbi:tail fiber domain-containing protein [Chryseobacterium sp. POE27]|uniref:tail fiber domain-containing protein n=1 Tax=Chryseobacterium sp. POE27 TaxID=3138177 RepID=UPI0032198667